MGEAALWSRRVLLVEDEVLVAMLAADMLAELGCVVIGPATRVQSALALAASEPLDCALLDVNVAGERVFPVADVLAERGIGFVFSTGYGASGVDARFAGRPVIQKPFRGAELARALQSVIGGEAGLRGGLG